jgi:hypothetical protein
MSWEGDRGLGWILILVFFYRSAVLRPSQPETVFPYHPYQLVLLCMCIHDFIAYCARTCKSHLEIREMMESVYG